MEKQSPMEPLLKIKGLTTQFQTEDGLINAVDNLDLIIRVGETVGLVGESGCGKSVTSLSVLRLVPDPPGKIAAGEILFRGENLLDLRESAMRKIRGREISMIFQEPMTSLNPVFTVGDQISEAVRHHEGLKKKAALEKAVSMLETVSIPDPRKRIHEYPHQLSGGMRQRVMIAMALSCNPSLLIADEPTTALDVTIQAQILDVLARLKDSMDLSMLLITHDLGVVAEVADRVVVMYAGKAVESASVKEIFKAPLHPYTQGLIRSIPRIDDATDPESGADDQRRELETIHGVVPGLADLPPGCAFEPRCEFAKPECSDPKRMTLVEPVPEHKVRCILHHGAS